MNAYFRYSYLKSSSYSLFDRKRQGRYPGGRVGAGGGILGIAGRVHVDRVGRVCEGVKCKVLGVRCQVSGVRFQV